MAKCGWKESGTIMRRWPVRRAGGLAALAPLFSLAVQAQPVIRVNVNLVRVVTTVKTQSG